MVRRDAGRGSPKKAEQKADSWELRSLPVPVPGQLTRAPASQGEVSRTVRSQSRIRETVRSSVQIKRVPKLVESPKGADLRRLIYCCVQLNVPKGRQKGNKSFQFRQLQTNHHWGTAADAGAWFWFWF